MFRRPRRQEILKPVGAYGSSAGRSDQIPVFHVHGYVAPDSGKQKEGSLRALVDPVLTLRDYESAWKNHAYSPTMGPQIHILRHYAALFLGFSFRDAWVSRLLSRLERERRDRKDRLFHYALIPETVAKEKGPGWFDRHGVKPIIWKTPKEIVALLGELYTAGLRADLRRDGSIELVELEARKKNPGPTGRVRSLARADVACVWPALLASRLSGLRTPPPGVPRPAPRGRRPRDPSDRRV